MYSRLAQLRRERGLSQAQLAERAGVARTQITRLEAGVLNTRLSTLNAVADALGVPAAALLNGAEDPIASINVELRGMNAAQLSALLAFLRAMQDSLAEMKTPGGDP